MRTLAFLLSLSTSGGASAQAIGLDRPALQAGDGEDAARAFISATAGGRKIAVRSEALSRPSLGIAFATTPSGAQIIVVMPRSPAEEAGLSAGKTITSVNGLSLAGLSTDEMAAALRRSSGTSVYGLAGGGQVAISRP